MGAGEGATGTTAGTGVIFGVGAMEGGEGVVGTGISMAAGGLGVDGTDTAAGCCLMAAAIGVGEAATGAVVAPPGGVHTLRVIPAIPVFHTKRLASLIPKK